MNPPTRDSLAAEIYARLVVQGEREFWTRSPDQVPSRAELALAAFEAADTFMDELDRRYESEDDASNRGSDRA